MRRSIAALKSASRVPTLQLGFVRCFSTASATPPNLKYVRVEHKGPVVWVTLTRAERHNAFNEDVIGEISQAFTYVTDTVNKGSNKVADGSDSLPRAVCTLPPLARPSPMCIQSLYSSPTLSEFMTAYSKLASPFPPSSFIFFSGCPYW